MNAPRILIVDDNPMNIQLAEFVLTSAAFQVRAIDDTALAMAEIGSFRPDLILMDIQMPGMDGLELMRLIKGNDATRHIKVVAFTAYAMKGDEMKMRAAGCDGYLPKPIDVRIFAAQVRAYLDAGAAPPWP